MGFGRYHDWYVQRTRRATCVSDGSALLRTPRIGLHHFDFAQHTSLVTRTEQQQVRKAVPNQTPWPKIVSQTWAFDGVWLFASFPGWSDVLSILFVFLPISFLKTILSVTFLGSMVRVGETDDERLYLKNSGTAQKRIHAVQLLFIGLMGLLLGWLGNFFVGTSCHFVNVPIQAGGGNNGQQGNFALHFGLWKYSPADSAMSGYSYCFPYSGSHDNEVPLVSRIANIAALALGTYSLIVLWWYLILGKAHATFWAIGVWTALLAAAAQTTTLYFFFDTLCQERLCSWGPASYLAIATAVAWIIIGFELHYQAPMATQHGKANLENLEMADLHSASMDYMDRFTSITTKPEVSYTPPAL